MLSPGTIKAPSNVGSDMFHLEHEDRTLEPIRLKIDATGKIVAEPYSKTI